jgi:phosphoribosylformylglycinamidine synthase I
MKKPRVCVVRTAGTNCDWETAFAFEKAGAEAERVHINRIVADKEALLRYEILALPGGFSYGDDIASGKIFANELKYKLAPEMKQFIRDGKLIIGICNGFQILVKAGFLPGNDALAQEATLTLNDSAKFEDRWTYLKSQGHKATKSQVRCVWAEGLPEIIYLPVAHGEGKFMARDESVRERLKAKGQVVFQYCSAKGEWAKYPDNPNGAEDNIAGICDETGRILGMMPHPERHIVAIQHPCWAGARVKDEGDGLQIFRNGVEYAKRIA